MEDIEEFKDGDAFIATLDDVLGLTGFDPDRYQLQDYIDADALIRLVNSFEGKFRIAFRVIDVRVIITEDGIVSTSKVRD